MQAGLFYMAFMQKKSFFDGAKLQAHNLSENNKRVYSVK
jgi:hypothetical protein